MLAIHQPCFSGFYYIMAVHLEQWINCKLAGREQLAAQGVPGRQVHKGVAGGSQRRGSVASPVMIGTD